MRSPASARHRSLLLAAAGYLILAFGASAHAWTGGAASTASCGCGDTALTLWFLAWPAHALAHGLDPLYSTALFHPTGVNLLSNTGVLAIGIPLAPITWLFGPVTTLNVAATLAPAASAVAAYALLARWVEWAPAAFVGGLVYGFCPFLLDNVAGGHLNIATLFLLPLMVRQLDELFVRQQIRPTTAGLWLGLMVVVQFFVSSELLLVMVAGMAIGLVVLSVLGLMRDRTDAWRRARRGLSGVAVAVGVSALLLAYPVWFALRGPAALTGRIWPTVGSFDVYTPRDLVVPFPGTGWEDTLRLWGYFGPVLPSEVYIGAGTVAVALLGLVVWRRDLRLWLFAVVGLVAAALAMGTVGEGWAPWRILGSLPLFDDVIQSRFVVITELCGAVVVAVVVDRIHRALAGRPRRAAALSVAVAALALAPLAATVVPALPLTTMPVVTPRWLATAAHRIPSHACCWCTPRPSQASRAPWPGRRWPGCPTSRSAAAVPRASPSGPGEPAPARSCSTTSPWPSGPNPAGPRPSCAASAAPCTSGAWTPWSSPGRLARRSSGGVATPPTPPASSPPCWVDRPRCRRTPGCGPTSRVPHHPWCCGRACCSNAGPCTAGHRRPARRCRPVSWPARHSSAPPELGTGIGDGVPLWGDALPV